MHEIDIWGMANVFDSKLQKRITVSDIIYV